MRILITGGAGFVGSNLALLFKEDDPTNTVVVLDNLKRRGSELNLARLGKHGIAFHHGDIRQPSDLNDLPGNFDCLIETSAEPSVQAGINSAPSYLLQTNLMGTVNCLEFARLRAACLIFLSTSRVYSIEPLRNLALRETDTRLELDPTQSSCGVSANGIAENFPTHLPRSLYGATKLASEQMIQEYVFSYGMKAVINRCGVIAGPGQFGKVDQGVFTLWVANHYFKKPLQYIGFGGTGKQVRDLLHPRDLWALIKAQLNRIQQCSGEVFNVGGGRAVSTSLLELTELCQRLTGNSVPLARVPETSPVDIPLYVSDCSRASERFDWRPQRSVDEIVGDIVRWLSADEAQLKLIFARTQERAS